MFSPRCRLGHRNIFPAPRYGDIHSHLGRWELYRNGQPGLIDFDAIESKYSPHACFPSRVWCGLIANATAECTADCPAAPHVAPAAASPDARLSPPVDPHDFVLEHYDVEMADDDRFEAGDDDRRSASPSLQVSPRTFLHQRRDLFNLDDGASPLTTEAPAITTTIPVDSPLAPIVRPLLSVPWACSLTPSPAQ